VEYVAEQRPDWQNERDVTQQVALLSQRDRAMLLVCSFNRTKRQEILFCCLWSRLTLRLLVINISSSSPAVNKFRRLLPAISVTICGTVVLQRRIGNTWPVGSLTARGEARYWLRIPILPISPAFDAPVRGFRRNIAMPFGAEN